MKHLLLICVLAIVLRPAFPVVDYIINYDYISKVLCVNKDRPELACNGKCYLMQSLAKAAAEENNQKKDNSVKKVEISPLFIEEAALFTTASSAVQHTANFPTTMDAYAHLDTSDFFHPPIA
mgnify:CR=1 FL=1